MNNKNRKFNSHHCVFASLYVELVRLRCCVHAFSNINVCEREKEEREREREREIRKIVNLSFTIIVKIHSGKNEFILILTCTDLRFS